MGGCEGEKKLDLRLHFLKMCAVGKRENQNESDRDSNSEHHTHEQEREGLEETL